MPVSQGLKNGLNKIREISSDIYHRYIPIIEDDTDIGAFASPIMEYPEVYDEFVKSLLYKLAYVQFETKYFRNPLRVLDGDRIPLGYSGQGIYVNPTKGRKFNPNDFAGILAKYEADVKVEYYALNMDTQYPVSIQRQSLKKAFTSWGELESFIDQLSNSLYNGAYIDEYRFSKAIVSSAYKDNKAVVEVINAPTSEEYAKAFVTKARELFLNFQIPLDKYNSWHKMGGDGAPITTWTNPEDIVILIRNDVRAYLDVNVLAESINIDKATLMGNIIGIDNWDIIADDGSVAFDGSKIVGIIADKAWFKIKTQDMFLDVDYNPNNRTYQYYLNNIRQYQFSLFANHCVFATEESDVAATAIDLGDDVELKAGETLSVPAVTTPIQANSEITFTISDEKIGGETVAAGSVATVTASSVDPKVAVVTGVAAGTFKLNASAESGSVTDTIGGEVKAAS